MDAQMTGQMDGKKIQKGWLDDDHDGKSQSLSCFAETFFLDLFCMLLLLTRLHLLLLR